MAGAGVVRVQGQQGVGALWLQGLIDNFLTCVVPLSTHPFGCRVIQRVLEHCQDAERKVGGVAC